MKNLGGSYSGCSNVPGLGMCQRLCCCSVVKSCLTLWDLVDCTTPDFTVLHCLPELAQTHLHCVDNTIQQFYPLFSPSSPAFNLSQHQDLFQSQFFESGGQSIGASASASVLSMNVQDWFLLGWTGWISLQSKGLSRVFSGTTVWKHRFFSVQPSPSNFHICI